MPGGNDLAPDVETTLLLREDANKSFFNKRLTYEQTTKLLKYGLAIQIPMLTMYMSELNMRRFTPDLYADYRQVFKNAADYLGLPYSPTYHRFYVSSFSGAFCYVNIGLAAVLLFKKNATNKDTLLLPFLTAATALTANEVITTFEPGRTFDWGDMGVYGAALSLFTACTYAGLKLTRPKPHPQSP